MGNQKTKEYRREETSMGGDRQGRNLLVGEVKPRRANVGVPRRMELESKKGIEQC